MTVEPTTGLHVLRNAGKQRSRLGEHCRVLASELDASISATRLAVPRRPRRGKGFSIDVATHGARKGLDRIHAKSVIELKRHDSDETPLRILIEGLANAVAVEENLPALSREIRAMYARRGLGGPVADTAAPVTVAPLAPDSYWERWQADGTSGRSVKTGARDEFRCLRAAITDAGYPVRLGTFAWPFDRDPNVRPAEVDW